jgi:hypothetical protein
VENTLLKGAGGTFLWVGFVIEELKKKSPIEVEDALKHLPQGLDEIYGRMLLQNREDRQAVAASILRWVTMAVRPLTLTELSVATGAKASAGLSCDDVMRGQVAFCGCLLTVIDNKVGLVHQSAKECLLGRGLDRNHSQLEIFRVKENETNSEIARICFAYI